MAGLINIHGVLYFSNPVRAFPKGAGGGGERGVRGLKRHTPPLFLNADTAVHSCDQATTSGRNHMTLKKSLDDGASWQVETLIYAGPAAYSLVVPLTNGSLGVVYERNGPGESALPCV